MKNLIIGILLGALAAAGVVYLLDDASEVAGESADRLPAGTSALSTQPTPASASARKHREERSPRPAESLDSTAAPEATATLNAAVRTVEIPGGSLATSPVANTPLDRLMKAYRIDCLYGPGYGGNWSQGVPAPHTAAWQGGEVTFDTIDLEKGTAVLKNSSGLTRTENGELPVRVQATSTGMHFTVFAPGGELIVATVYGMLDAKKANATVVSFHGPHLAHESAQFYGACTAR